MAFCSNCGKQISDQAVSCPQCGHPGPAAAGVAPQQQYRAIAADAQGRPYASWGQRVGAALLDGVIVAIPSWIIMTVASIGFVSGTTITRDPVTGEVTNISVGHGFLIGFIVSLGIVTLIGILYKVLMEGSPRGQTLGKMALHIQVRDATTGGPINYGKAFLRWLVEVVLWMIIYIPGIVDALFPLWDVKRQTLHDKAAATIVVQAPQ